MIIIIKLESKSMDYFNAFLFNGGIGMLFGFFPGWAQSRGLISEAVFKQFKIVPGWLCRLFLVDPEQRKYLSVEDTPRINTRLNWYYSLIYMFLVLILIDVVGNLNHVSKGWLNEIIGAMSFHIFLFSTWLLPVYILKRFLRKLKPQPEPEPDRHTFYDK
jgi:hypothetical protein